MEDLACPLCGERDTIQALHCAAAPERFSPMIAVGMGACGITNPDLQTAPPAEPVTCAWCGCGYSPSARREAARYREVRARRKGMEVDAKIRSQQAARQS